MLGSGGDLLKKLWFFLILLGMFFSFMRGQPEIVTEVVLNDLQKSIDLIISLLSVMAFWSGLMRVVEKSGILGKASVFFKPLISFLFKDIEDNKKAVDAVLMNIAANMFGIGNAATALGINAMQEIQKTNKNKLKATNSMCMFLIINVSSIQLIPITVIKLRSDSGAQNPADIMLPTLIATLFSTTVAILLAKYFERKES
jgi:spore maturation protein A